MANPFLVLGGVAASVVLAGVGILSVPGWVNAANDFAVIHDLSQVSDVQAASASKTGNYAKTVAELEDGVVGQGARIGQAIDVIREQWARIVEDGVIPLAVPGATGAWSVVLDPAAEDGAAVATILIAGEEGDAVANPTIRSDGSGQLSI